MLFALGELQGWRDMKMSGIRVHDMKLTKNQWKVKKILTFELHFRLLSKACWDLNLNLNLKVKAWFPKWIRTLCNATTSGIYYKCIRQSRVNVYRAKRQIGCFDCTFWEFKVFSITSIFPNVPILIIRNPFLPVGLEFSFFLLRRMKA